MNIAKLFSREVHQGVIDEQAPTAGGCLEQLLDLKNCQIIGFDLPFTHFDLIIISFLNYKDAKSDAPLWQCTAIGQICAAHLPIL